MNIYSCEHKICCSNLAIVASIVVGIAAAILRYTALITVTPAFLWVTLGIAIGLLGITLLGSSLCGNERSGCCYALKQFLNGILGTILTSLILLGITFAATSVAGAIITGLLLFFFSLTVTGATCLINCRYNCN